MKMSEDQSIRNLIDRLASHELGSDKMVFCSLSVRDVAITTSCFDLSEIIKYWWTEVWALTKVNHINDGIKKSKGIGLISYIRTKLTVPCFILQRTSDQCGTKIICWIAQSSPQPSPPWFWHPQRWMRIPPSPLIISPIPGSSLSWQKCLSVWEFHQTWWKIRSTGLFHWLRSTTLLLLIQHGKKISTTLAFTLTITSHQRYDITFFNTRKPADLPSISKYFAWGSQ